MNETQLVMNALQTLHTRECNGHVRVRLGAAITTPSTFRSIFSQFSRGTYFADVALEIESIPVVVGCDCGYRRRLVKGSYLYHNQCPRCHGQLDIEQGTEFEILEPAN